MKTFIAHCYQQIALCKLFWLAILRSGMLPFVFWIPQSATSQTPVEEHGQLYVSGKYIQDINDEIIQLKGMSLFWSQWMAKYYNYHRVKWLRDVWNCSVVRAAMAVESGGYLSNPEHEESKIDTIVNAALKLGMYVIVDWHDHNALDHKVAAQNFFVSMAKKYGHFPNIIYETFNEPLGDISWGVDLKPYHEAVIDSIRKYDPDNLVICGTGSWSQDVDAASESPLADANVAYALHYYAASHKQFLRDKASIAMSRGLALFVSEFGTCTYSGSGTLDFEETNTWWNFLEDNKISWCNWSIADKDETSAALMPGASSTGGWDLSMISPSGKRVREKLREGLPTSAAIRIQEENSDNQIINVYSDPTNDILIIQTNEHIFSDAVICLYDQFGRLIIQQKCTTGTKTTVNLSGAPKGLNFIVFKNDEKFAVRKVTVY